MLAPMPDTNEKSLPPLGYAIIDRLTQPQFLLACLSTGFLWWLTYRLLGDTVPDRMREVVSVLVGFITGQMVGPGWQFYFGNTKASEDKSAALKANADTMRQAGLSVGSDPTPVTVEIVQPEGDPLPVSETPTSPDKPEPQK